MKNWIMALAAMAVVGSGCSPITLEPLEPPVAPGDPVTKARANLLVMRGGDAVWDSRGSHLMPGELWTNPDSLVLFFSSEIQECSDPPLAPRCAGPNSSWQTVMVIPPELARPGLIDLRDRRIIKYSRSSNFEGTIDCGGGEAFGSIFDGTLELISSGPSSLSVKLRDGVTNIGGYLMDGDYPVQLCGVAPLASTPTPALAIRGADLPPGSTPPGGGATPDPDTLFVSLGTLPATCQDPWSSANCTAGTSLAFSLPLALQQPGLIDLSDPAIAATYTIVGPNSSSICGQPTAAPEGGTIEILSSDANGLSFKIYGSYSESAVGGIHFGLDGLYAASICP